MSTSQDGQQGSGSELGDRDVVTAPKMELPAFFLHMEMIFKLGYRDATQSLSSLRSLI